MLAFKYISRLIILIAGVLSACVKIDTDFRLPEVTTLPVEELRSSSASSGGKQIRSNAPILEKGVCWSELSSPMVYDDNTTDGAGYEGYKSVMQGLKNNTTYYVRAYATNKNGTGYGNIISFKTPY